MLLYALTILVSAFLLFQVQPIIAKIILPWFGGSAAVWAVCLLFFQAVLLLGYLYAYLLFRYLKPKTQGLVHTALLAVSLAVLPIIPNAVWKPTGAIDPTFRILGLLAVTVGLPYFLLSTTGPLLQAWYARHYEGALPYRLYALSNAGSMFALLSYPVLFEPVFGTRRQAIGWSAGFAVFAVLCAITALSARRFSGKPAHADPAAEEAPGLKLHLLWVLLPACASALLLAITNHLSQNVAPIPFLWVLPLSLYLLSFILCFEGHGWYRRYPFLQLLAVALGGMAYSLSEDFENAGLKLMIPLFAAGLFICCMVCHGELVRLKPHPRYLTSFYLMISLGGAIGGFFVALAAPHLFNGNYELPVSLIGCGALITFLLYGERSKLWKNPAFLISAALTIAMAVYLGQQIRKSAKDVRIMSRNFYGELKVSDSGSPSEEDATRRLIHGTINHGEQFLAPERRDQPTTYYGPNSGVGLAIRQAQQWGPERVGVIGLGTGTLAAYGRRGDYYRFYEINPLVIQLATTQFTFLKDCQAKVDLAVGDARLSLEREHQQDFDVLAVDAFSGDSIPVHLLTREAFQLYFRHLKRDGVLAVHVSNKYLDLEPVVDRIAASLDKQAGLVDTDDDDENDVFGSTWVLVTSRPGYFDESLIRGGASPLTPKKSLRIWTDDYSNLFQILK